MARRLRKDAMKAMREAGRIFGREGGKARAKNLSPQQRSEIARRAVQARWAKAKKRRKGATCPRRRASPREGTPLPADRPTDPLERLHIYWAELFFGTLKRIDHHDRRLHLRLQLELERFGQLDPSEVIAEGGESLKFLPPPSSAFSKYPTDAVLDQARAFHRASPSLPSLKGQIRGNRLEPPLEKILFTYYEHLTKERKRPRRRAAKGEQAPHERALEGAREELGYTSSVATFRKDLERARATYPDTVKLLKQHGLTMIESD